MSKRLKWLIALGIFVIYLFISYRMFDPDFGWHIKMGQLILNHGIPKIDPFSFSMPNFPYIDHEWLTNILLYQGYHYLGYFFLATIFALIATLATIINIFPLKTDIRIKLMVLMMITACLCYFVGVRPQVIGWLFVALIINLATDEKKWLRYRYLLPLLMLVWANMHGSYPLLLLFILAIVINSIFYKKYGNFLSNSVVFLVTLLATFINPYAAALWGEIQRSLFDRNLITGITEWLPTFMVFRFVIIPMTALFILLMIHYWRRTNILEKIIAVILTGGMMTSQRHLPIWSLWAGLSIAQYLTVLKAELVIDPITKKRWHQLLTVFTIIIACLVFFDLTIKIIGTVKFRQSKEYPVAAAKFLESNYKNKKVFSSYNWGGYLIWQAPDSKYFVDGRMPSWKENPPISNDSAWAFKDYQNLVTGKSDLNEAITKYKIDLVLLPSQGDLSNLIEKFQQLGWQKTYQDDTATILKP